MRYLLFTLVIPTLLVAGCVLDRTGRSGTSMVVRDVQANRIAVEQVRGEVDLERGRLDEIDDRATLARRNIAQSNATAENLVESVQALAGEFQMLRRQLEASEAFDNDVDYRLSDMDFRLMAIEEHLGIEPPIPAGDDDPGTAVEGAESASEGGDAAGGDDPGGGASARGDADMAAIDIDTLTRSPDAGPAGAGELDLLAHALQAMGDERYAQAGKAFSNFLERYPGSERAGEARKLLGDTLNSMGKYRDAIHQYETFINEHRGHELVPEAMLRQGLCFIDMGSESDLQSARVFLDDLIEQFPDSPEAEKARRKLEILE